MVALPQAGDDPARSTSSCGSRASSSHRSFVASGSFREAWQTPPNVFSRSGRQHEHDDEEELRWAAIERLPTYDRLRKGMLRQVLDDGQVVHGEIDVRKLKMEDKKQLMDNILKVVEEDNEKVGMEIPKIEVRFEQLSVEGDVYIGSRALPTLFNATINTIEKTGKITYCGHEFNEFVPQRTCAYISQHDLHRGEMTVRETLDFSGQCLGVGTRYEMLAELARREKGLGIKPNPGIDAFMKATAQAGQETSVVTDYILKEVTSKKDQEQYWYRKDQPYQFVSVPDFVEAFKSFRIGDQLINELQEPYDKSRTHPAALVTEKYGIPNWELFKACFAREWLMMKRNSFVYVFKTMQITIMSLIAMTVFLRTQMPVGKVADGGKFFGALFFSLFNVMFNGMAELATTVFRLPVFYKQRDLLFYPPFFRQFLALFGVHQMALSLFRFIAAVGRTLVMANTLGTFTMPVVFVLGGFIVAKNDIRPFMLWGYYVSPMMYGQNAIVMNEFLDKRWSAEMKNQGIVEDRLQLLRDVSGAFRPGILTALVGVSGAGKTTLMDVLAGRKTGGYIEGSISISGFPKNQATFARISGYCEQNDIHSRYVTVYESLLYSAWLRLSSDVKPSSRKVSSPVNVLDLYYAYI
ncbi:hypothetical protein CRG98_030228 [Punica granatum]|uniref:ABC transporter domain-containing protein n=1 Tax=Punica granatum TaxID=22663 RepID=A0A2I0J039_PUNGR|nr:hypothetical protein CRG98_030228 [Punica granatum]